MSLRENDGFTLVELLIVVAIIGVLSAIAIPNLITAMQRAKQKRTMADIRAIAGAWESREVDVGHYNAAGWSLLPSPVDFGDLEVGLTPTYIREMPRNDGWGTPWTIKVTQPWGDSNKAHTYQIISGARDGQIAESVEVGGTTNFDCDIVYQNGSFHLYPEGVQTSK